MRWMHRACDRCCEATELARQKGLSVVSGLAWRYDTGVQETMQRVHDGAIGEIRPIQEVCNTGSLRSLARRPGMTEMEYQIYNWYDFNWLSADLPGLNLVHNVDKGAWALHDAPPLKAWGMGGREVRKGPTFGDVFDHHATVFEYAGRRAHVCATAARSTAPRPMSPTVLIGTRGSATCCENRIEGRGQWRYDGPASQSVRPGTGGAVLSRSARGTPINNGLYMARSSLLALDGHLVFAHGRRDHVGAGHELAAPGAIPSVMHSTPRRRHCRAPTATTRWPSPAPRHLCDTARSH